MNRLFLSLAIVALLGVGCTTPWQKQQPVVPAETVPATAHGQKYQNPQYGFTFEYPSAMEPHIRAEDVRQTKYLGLDVDFFVSLRDLQRANKPTNIAYFYATPTTLTIDAFKKALEATDASVKVTNTESITIGDIPMTKVTSTTALGTDKIHYLFNHNSSTIIVSVFIGEDTSFESVLQSFLPL